MDSVPEGTSTETGAFWRTGGLDSGRVRVNKIKHKSKRNFFFVCVCLF